MTQHTVKIDPRYFPPPPQQTDDDDDDIEISYRIEAVVCPFCNEQSRGLVPKTGHGGCEHCGLTTKQAVSLAMQGVRG